MNIEAWQLCILVTAAIVLVEFALNAVLRWREKDNDNHEDQTTGGNRVRTVALGLLTLLTIIIGVVALGPSLADQLASVAASVTAVVAVWLTYRSYQSPHNGNPPGPGLPKIPTARPDPDRELDASTGGGRPTAPDG
jgi:membrane protein implicated in regulation of membrane protease activity